MNKLLTILAATAFTIGLFGFNSVIAQDVPDQDAIINNLDDRSDGDSSRAFGLPRNNANSSALQNILETVFTAAGGLAAVFIAVGGLRYVLSDGNDQKIQQAKDTITYAIVGVVISLSGFIIVRFFLSAILNESP